MPCYFLALAQLPPRPCPGSRGRSGRGFRIRLGFRGLVDGVHPSLIIAHDLRFHPLQGSLECRALCFGLGLFTGDVLFGQLMEQIASNSGMTGSWGR